ncbi:unnamed protein product [Spirodela intermedia]|uniref:Uncharacterized protein n=1 Tax=Spirodela intermedia TaxID=51605 RepID=A0ABN7EBZ9_SPIIN|nr:unnamed protein product [Spirodela intermedia]
MDGKEPEWRRWTDGEEAGQRRLGGWRGGGMMTMGNGSVGVNGEEAEWWRQGRWRGRREEEEMERRKVPVDWR